MTRWAAVAAGVLVLAGCGGQGQPVPSASSAARSFVRDAMAWTDGAVSEADLLGVRATVCRETAAGTAPDGVLRAVVAEHRAVVGHVPRDRAGDLMAAAERSCIE